MSIHRPIVSLLCLLASATFSGADEFEKEIRPLVEKYCVNCHGGEKTSGDVDFSGVRTLADAESDPELWELVSLVIEEGEMPPEDEPQPSGEERARLTDWIEHDFFGEIESLPGVFRPRRLSGPEYRNTMRTLFGFDLEVNIAEAEQTVSERSLVLKLLPTDPPGVSGFVNDTHGARLSTTIWDQYSYLADFALTQYFRENPEPDDSRVAELVEDFVSRALRRPVPEEQLRRILRHLEGRSGAALIETLKSEWKAVLMSPAFLYRGFLMGTDPDRDQFPVDDYELAERLSYFLWEDMPDAELFELAGKGRLSDPGSLRAQVDRMLASPRSRTLAESFAFQWLLLDQIRHERNDPPYLHALKTQPLDFLHYLFTEDRPVIEFIDSDVTFINALIGGYYGRDRAQLTKVVKPRGIERMALPLQRISLEDSMSDRGAGILTMPGILAMNEGPILRGTWMLRKILGEHLGEPPPDVPPIQAAPRGKERSFRERFEAHRADRSCALCHDKIDPLGFALEGYDRNGGVIGKHQSGRKKAGGASGTATGIDTSGRLPGGESFSNFAELHALLLSSQREKIIRNAVEQLLAYALCRKLERNDRPTVDELTARILDTNGTWRDLIHGIVESVPFRETQVPAKQGP